MYKKRDWISTIIAMLFWFIFRDPDVPVEILPEPDAFYSRKCIILSQNNFHEILTGQWIVVVEGLDSKRVPARVYEKEWNIAILKVKDNHTAGIAARLGVRSFNEILFVENECVEDVLGKRKVRTEIEWADVLDYRLFFAVSKLRKQLLKNVEGSGGLFEFIFLTLARVIEESWKLAQV